MVQRRSSKRRSQRGGLESAKEVHTIASDIKLMFSSDKALAKKYNKDPDAFAKAVARKHNVRLKTAAVASMVAAASAMTYGVVQHKKANKYKKESAKYKKESEGRLKALRSGEAAKAKIAERKKKKEDKTEIGLGDMKEGFFGPNFGGKRRRRRRSSKRRSSKRRSSKRSRSQRRR